MKSGWILGAGVVAAALVIWSSKSAKASTPAPAPSGGFITIGGCQVEANMPVNMRSDMLNLLQRNPTADELETTAQAYVVAGFPKAAACLRSRKPTAPILVSGCPVEQSFPYQQDLINILSASPPPSNDQLETVAVAYDQGGFPLAAACVRARKA